MISERALLTLLRNLDIPCDNIGKLTDRYKIVYIDGSSTQGWLIRSWKHIQPRLKHKMNRRILGPLQTKL